MTLKGLRRSRDVTHGNSRAFIVFQDFCLLEISRIGRRLSRSSLLPARKLQLNGEGWGRLSSPRASWSIYLHPHVHHPSIRSSQKRAQGHKSVGPAIAYSCSSDVVRRIAAARRKLRTTPPPPSSQLVCATASPAPPPLPPLRHWLPALLSPRS